MKLKELSFEDIRIHNNEIVLITKKHNRKKKYYILIFIISLWQILNIT